MEMRVLLRFQTSGTFGKLGAHPEMAVRWEPQILEDLPPHFHTFGVDLSTSLVSCLRLIPEQRLIGLRRTAPLEAGGGPWGADQPRSTGWLVSGVNIALCALLRDDFGSQFHNAAAFAAFVCSSSPACSQWRHMPQACPCVRLDALL